MVYCGICHTQVIMGVCTKRTIVNSQVNHHVVLIGGYKHVKGGKFLKKLWCCVGGSIVR